MPCILYLDEGFYNYEYFSVFGAGGFNFQHRGEYCSCRY
jgi:hypothetical protein